MNSNEVRRQWAERSGEFSPAYYAYYGPDERSEAVHDILERVVGRDVSVLELGCSSGRHLSYLYDHGFTELAGIELNDDALEVMAESYPDLAADGTFYLDAIEDAVGDFADGQFDVVYSVETLQHIHPDAAWVFEELARITDELLVTVENEPDGDDRTAGPDVSYVHGEVPLYHRNWNAVFTELGFVELEARDGSRDTVRAFRSSDADR